jgi:hypothetical protein
MNSFLNARLELKVEDHARVGATILLDSLPLFKIGTVDLSVVLRLAGLHQTRVNLLIATELPRLAQQMFAFPCQRDYLNALNRTVLSVPASIDEVGVHQILLAKKTQIALRLSAVTAIDGLGQIACTDDAKAPHFTDRANLFRAKPQVYGDGREAVPANAGLDLVGVMPVAWPFFLRLLVTQRAFAFRMPG